MGFLALSNDEQRTALLLDVGGTTTDIAFMTKGVPLFEEKGVQIEKYLTSIRGLLNRSIPYGGDSCIEIDTAGNVIITPRRVGSAVAFGGEKATLTDALVVLGLMKKGDTKRASQALRDLNKDIDIQLIAKKIVDQFYQIVHKTVNELLTELNTKPVYTIRELLSDNQLKPEVIMMIGGPAEALLHGLADKLELIPIMPLYHQVANALGAAVARPTLETSLYADTAQRFYRLSRMDGKVRIQGRFTIYIARKILLEHTQKLANQINNVEITHEESFNIVREFTTQGQILHLTAQIKPGIDITLKPCFSKTHALNKGGLADDKPFTSSEE